MSAAWGRGAVAGSPGAGRVHHGLRQSRLTRALHPCILAWAGEHGQAQPVPAAGAPPPPGEPEAEHQQPVEQDSDDDQPMRNEWDDLMKFLAVWRQGWSQFWEGIKGIYTQGIKGHLNQHDQQLLQKMQQQAEQQQQLLQHQREQREEEWRQQQ